MGTGFSTVEVYIWAVVPILPALPALLVLLPMIGLSVLLAIAALFRPATLARLARLAWRQRWSLLIIAACFSGLWWMIQGISSGGPRRPAPAAAFGEWPMDRRNLLRHGSATDAEAPIKPGIIWQNHTAGEAFYSSAAIAGDRVYIVGSRGDRGRIYCWNATDGQLLWSTSPPGYRATFSSPVISGQWLVCGEGLHHAREARVVCIDLRAGHEGELAWSFKTHGHVECTPVIDHGRVYFGAGDDGVYCLDLENVQSSIPKVIWHAPAKNFPDAETSIAVYQNRVYVGLGLGGNALCVLDANTGQQLQRFEFPYPIFSPPAIDGDKLYLGMGVGDYVTPNEKPAGQVCCIDLPSLTIDWTFPTNSNVLGAVCVDERGLVFASAAGIVYRVDKHGQELARFATHAQIGASPAAAQNVVVVVNYAGMLYAVNRDTLQPLWEQRLGEPGRFISSPAIAQGHVYVGTEADGVFCVGHSSPARKLTQWPGELGGGGVAGCRDGSAIPHPAELLWHFPAAQSGPVIVTAPVAPVDDGIIVPVSSGDLAGLLYLQHAAGNQLNVKWQLAFEGGVWSSPAIANDRVFFVAGNRGDEQRKLYGILLDDPDHRWTVPVDKEAAGILLADEHSLIVQPERNMLAAYDHDGERLWEKRIGKVEQLVTGHAAILAVAIDEPPGLVLLDRPTGAYLWRTQLDERPRSAPVITTDSILVGTHAGLELRRIEDGHLLATNNKAAGGIRGPIFVDSSVCLFVNIQNELIAANSNDLLTIAVQALGDQPAQNILLTSRVALIQQQDRIRRFIRITDSFLDKEWLATSDLGNITSPLVLHQGKMYFGTSQRGVVCIARGTRE